MLERETDWRQGDLLTCKSAIALGLVDETKQEQRAIVITHDCDLPHESEHYVEVIVADLVVKDPKPDPQLSYAKNPRRLHLAYESSDPEPLILELQHGDRCAIPKASFAECAIKDDRHILSVDAKRVLKQWLAARYGRPAFPNEFEKRLRKGNVDRRIARILKPAAKHLVGLFFDLGEQRGAEVGEGEPYALSVSVVYDATEGGKEARETAVGIAERLRELFEEVYGKPNDAKEIALDACVAVADTHLTLSDLRRVDQWRLEYISLRDGDQGDFMPVGELPA